MIRRFGLYLALLFAVTAQAVSYTPSSVPSPKAQGQACYVSNPDAILPDSVVTWLNSCASRLEAETKVELATVALSSIGSADVFDFAYELFQRWGIGRKGQNTGVLILFVEQSHDIRIMTGVGMDGILTDAQCSAIIHDEMIPAFRRGDYGGGLCLGALRIYEICIRGEAPEELRNIRSVTNRGGYEEEKDESLIGLIFLLIILIVIIAVIWWSWGKDNTGGSGSGSSGGGHTGGYYGGYRGGGFGGGSFGGGGSWGGGSTFGGGAGGKW